MTWKSCLNLGRVFIESRRFLNIYYEMKKNDLQRRLYLYTRASWLEENSE